VKFYDFIDKGPPIGTLVVIEGGDPILSETAIARIVERLLDPASRDLNLDRFDGPHLESMEAVATACAAMPFLGSGRVIVVRSAQDMRAAARRALWDVAQAVPHGNTLIVEDLLALARRAKPEGFGELAGRAALRIDANAGKDARARFVREALGSIGASAEPAVIAAMANGEAPLVAVRTDLEKLALSGDTITMQDLIRESMVVEDVKGYQAASALVEGNAERALALTSEMIVAHGDRGAAPALLSAIAAEYRLLWDLARPGGEVPARFRWRERALRPIARRLGPQQARVGYERAVKAFEAMVTGRADDLRAVVATLAAVAASDGREPRSAKTSEIA
jgi:DNA polymerase III subunit delta